MKSPILPILLLSFVVSGCAQLERIRLAQTYEQTLADWAPTDTTVTDITANRDNEGRQAMLLSAFYGLDDDLPRVANLGVCEGAGGADGLPIIFSHEIDVSTMQAGDFRITTASGKVGEITCVTLAPADDKGELRTALFAGQYGSIEDQPVKVEVIGNLLSLDGSVNFRGASSTVTALEEGPTIVLAEVVPENEWELGKAATALAWGGGSGCPVDTKLVVRIVWSGGVTKPGGDEVDDKERLQYQVTLLREDGSTVDVVPFALGDLEDGDNNHRLCLGEAGKPQSVFFPAGFMTDPRDDLNPDTSVAIQK